MTIFDGVPIKPTLSPTMQGALSLMAFVANSLVAADRCRQERLAGEGKRPTTLEEVMEKSGLKIPGIHEALVQIMGGSEEAKKAASLIVNTPDPASLLRQFAEQFGCGMSANPGPIVTPPPASKPASVPTPGPTVTPPTTSSGLPKYRPDFTREAREAAKTAASAPESPMPKYRPDFTREAREAGKAAAAHSSGGVGREVHEPMPPVATPAVEQPRPSLVSMVEHQLGALRRRMKAHEAELDLRLKRAEAELAILRQELFDLRSARKEPARVAMGAMQAVESSVAARARAPMVDAPAVVTDIPVAVSGATVAVTAAAPPPMVDEPAFVIDIPVAVSEDTVAVAAPEVAGPEAVLEAMAVPGADPPLLVAASEQEVARAVELIGEFAEEAEEHHQLNLVRVITVEREVSAMRALVQLERQAAGASAHG